MSNHQNFRRTAIVIALSAVFPIATVWADEVEDLISPDVAEVTIKLPYQDKVNPLYRQYDGVNKEGVSGSANIEYVTRKEADWFKVNARNLGLSTQEASVLYERQGDWSLGLSYDQIPRYSPYAVSTAVTGIGTNTIKQPTYPNSAFSGGALIAPQLSDVTLKTERDITTLTASKFLREGVKVNFSFKDENKTGTRMDGVRGAASLSNGSVNRYSGFLFSPEPIDQNHKQFEANVDYSGKQYQLIAGYYGSFLSTKYNSLTVTPGGNNNTGLYTPSLSPIALAPDNSVQQFYVNGAYNFSADTRANLKVAYSEGRQDDTFLAGQPTQSGIGLNLAGKVQTTEIYSSLTSRLTKDLKVLASWRYEDKKDKTPLFKFYNDGTTTNNPESHVANWGKLEADYRIGAGYGLTVGVDYTNKTKMEWEAITSNAANGYSNVNASYSRSMSELTTRMALRKTMSETVNGTLSVAHSERTGSDAWNGTSSPPIYPVYLADRNRDKVRGMVDWTAAENLDLQVAYEAFFDDYSKSTFGLDKGNGQVFSLDGNYALNDVWKMNAWYSKQVGDSSQNMQGAVCSTTNGSNCTSNTARIGVPLVLWDAKLKQDSEQFGLGLAGKVRVFNIGAQYLYSRDVNKQEISAMPGTTFTAVDVSRPVASGNGVLPDTKYTQNTIKLFGVYPVDKATKVRLDYIYDIRKMDDYTWSQWVYADGTKVYVKPEQNTQIIGLSLIHAF